VNEPAIADVDADMRRAWEICLEEHQISGGEPARRPSAGVVLCIRRARYAEAAPGKNVLNVPRAVEASWRFSPEDVWSSDKPQRIAKQTSRKARHVPQHARCETADPGGSLLGV